MFAGLRFTDPQRHAEQLVLVEGLIQRADQWRQGPIVLPRGVELLAMSDDQGRRVHTIKWPSPAPLSTSVFFYDRAIAVEVTWTLFVLRRPWAIDGERLRELVERPPVPTVRIFAALVAIRTAEWSRRGVMTAALASAHDLPPDDPQGIERAVRAMARLKKRYEARAFMGIHELSALLDVEEPDAGLGYELGRWRWMLHDYAEALDAELGERVQALADRFDHAEPYLVKPIREALNDLSVRRQIDAATGLLLAHAAMRESAGHPASAALGYVDPLSTRAPGSPAWWCTEVLEAWREDQIFGDRLAPEQLDRMVDFARRELDALDASWLRTLSRVFVRAQD